MNHKVAIVDDEEDARELLKIHLQKHANLQLIGEASNGVEALKLIQDQQPDIVLLDIQMPEMNGLELVQHLADMPHFIFVTAYDEFALKAFELNAVDYLLKPISTARFNAAIQKVRMRLQTGNFDKNLYQLLLKEIDNNKATASNYIKRIAYKTGLKTQYINTDSIILIEAADQYVNLFTKDQKFLIRQSMDYLEEMLDPNIFFRTHRSYIIRLEEVGSLEQLGPKNILIFLKNGQKAKLSRIRKQLFLNRLNVG